MFVEDVSPRIFEEKNDVVSIKHTHPIPAAHFPVNTTILYYYSHICCEQNYNEKHNGVSGNITAAFNTSALRLNAAVDDVATGISELFNRLKELIGSLSVRSEGSITQIY